MARTPNFILKEDFVLDNGLHDKQWLYSGSFVRPIILDYVPRETRERPKWKYFNADREVWCYTRLGLVPIPKHIICEI